jgi:hypothetical protein
VLTSDHGVQRLPEQGNAGRRINALDVQCIQSSVRSVADELAVQELFVFEGYLNEPELRARKIPVRKAAELVSRNLVGCSAVRAAFPYTSFLGEPLGPEKQKEGLESVQGPEREPFHQEFWRGFVRSRSPHVTVLMEEGVLPIMSHGTAAVGGVAIGGTTHGSPYDYDARVPIAISHPTLAPMRFADKVMVADLKNSLQALLLPSFSPSKDGEPEIQKPPSEEYQLENSREKNALLASIRFKNAAANSEGLDP